MNAYKRILSNWYEKDYFPAILISFCYFVVFYFFNSFWAYGYFRDEFYYIACSQRLDLGYIDHPPFSIWILKIWITLFGESLASMRFLPTLFSAIVVLYSGLIAKEIDGNRFSIGLASFVSIFTPFVYMMSGFYSMNSIEVLLWVLTIYYFIKLINTRYSRIWIIIGILIGIGLLNKHTSVILMFGIFIGLIFTGYKTELKKKYLWFGVAIAFIIFLPNLLWQAFNGFPSIEFYRMATERKNINMPPLASIIMQIVTSNPFIFPVWLLGVYYIFFNDNGRRYKPVGFIYLFMMVLMVVSGSSRPDRIGGIYPILFAFGSVFISELIYKFRKNRLRKVLVFYVSITGIFMLAVLSPIIPPVQLAGLYSTLGIKMEFEKGVVSKIHQNLADRLGWEEEVDIIRKAYYSLSEEEKKECVIFADNYGQAGAIEVLGKKYGLPKVLCGHNNYWHWGTYGASGKIVITIGRSKSSMEEGYGDVRVFSIHKNEYGVPHENNLPILICRKPKFKNLDDIWPSVRFYV